MQRRRFNGRERAALYLASGGKCAVCGVHLSPGWHADHRQAYVHGGVTDVVNGQALCPTCNLKKGSGADMGQATQGVPAMREWQVEALDQFLASASDNFMVEAFPAAGKTRLMIEAAQRKLASRAADAIVVIVPSRYLCYQVAQDFHDHYGIELNPDWSADTDLVTARYRGIVTTYAWMNRNSLNLRAAISRHSVLVICDEIHHAGENEWGKALKYALEPAHKRLLMTGTPFRTDDTPIPYVGYIPMGEYGLVAHADYRVRYGYCLSQKWVRPIYFHRHDGLMTWKDKDGQHEATFDKGDLDARGRSRRLQTAIFEEGEHVGGMLQSAHQKLMELRQVDPDAAGIVWTMHKTHAKQIAARMASELGATPLIVYHDLEGLNPHNLIEGFKSSHEPWIICVDMVSEGVSIPRLRVGVYLTNTVTPMYFTQSIGRLLRMETNHKEQSAHLYMPDDPRLRQIADDMANEVDRVMRERRIRDPRDDDGTGQSPESRFVPISASYELKGVTVHGDYLSPSILAYAETLKASGPSVDFPAEALAYYLNKAGVTPPSAERSSTSTQPHDAPLYKRLASLGQQNAAMVSKIAHQYALRGDTPDYAAIQTALNKAAGIDDVPTCDDPTALKRRLEIAQNWYLTGEAPKEFRPR